MNTARLYFVLIILMTPMFATADDMKINDAYGMQEIAHEYYHIEDLRDAPLQQVTSIIILDAQGNKLREAEIESSDLIEKYDIFKPFIHQCDFLTNVNGVIYYLKRD